MENTKQTEDRIARVLESRPQINRDALERSRQVEEQLAAIGIRLDDYRLGPALGGHRGSPRVSPGARTDLDVRVNASGSSLGSHSHA